MVWGGTYAVLRNWLPRAIRGDKFSERDLQPGMVSFTSNLLAGAAGTMASSPLNYARNLQYGHNVAHASMPMKRVFDHLRRDADAHMRNTGGSRLVFAARRLAIGWGTLRVALGLGFTSQVYGYCVASPSLS